MYIVISFYYYFDYRDENVFGSGGDLLGCPAGKCATNRWSIRVIGFQP